MSRLKMVSAGMAEGASLKCVGHGTTPNQGTSGEGTLGRAQGKWIARAVVITIGIDREDKLSSVGAC